MALALLLGIGLVFTSLFLIFAAVGGAAGERRGVSRSLEVLEAMTGAPDELKQELDRPFGERVLEPLLSQVATIGRRITGADQAERIRHRLDRAGNPEGWSVDRIASAKVLGAIGGFGIGLLFAFALELSLPMRVLLLAGVTAFGFFLPNVLLYNTAVKREETMEKEMADAIDLLTISVEAGLGFDAALQQVARNTHGPLAGELSRALQEMQIGRSRSDALRGLADRTHMADLKSFVSAMVQADAFGIPIGQVLRVQSHEMRTKRRQRAEEKAAQVPVKIMIPVILFILPCLLIVVVGPAAISVIDAFSGT